MTDSMHRQDALAHRALVAKQRSIDAPSDVTVTLCPPRTQLALRGDATAPAFTAALRSVLGVAAPVAAHQVIRGDGVAVIWMGPDEWLIVTDEVDDALCMRLESRLGDTFSLLSDVSHSRVVLAVRGARARDTLSKGCPLDLHPLAFAVGSARQSHLARGHALFHLVDDTPTFHVYVHRSFADYFYTWLLDASGEFQAAAERAGSD